MRIAWSVACGVACVLMVVFWVRSYWWIDEAAGPTPDGYVIFLASSVGDLEFGRELNNRREWPSWTVAHGQAQSSNRWPGARGSKFEWRWSAIGIYCRVPFWFPVLGAAVCSLLPWVGRARRFSLRTLLVATTLVAVVLGAIAYAAR